MQDSGRDNACLGSCDLKLTAQKSEVKDSSSLSEGSLEFVHEVPGAPSLRVVGACTPALRKSRELPGTVVGFMGRVHPTQPKGWA